jgi:hypothetical protein
MFFDLFEVLKNHLKARRIKNLRTNERNILRQTKVCCHQSARAAPVNQVPA